MPNTIKIAWEVRREDGSVEQSGQASGLESNAEHMVYEMLSRLSLSTHALDSLGRTFMSHEDREKLHALKTLVAMFKE